MQQPLQSAPNVPLTWRCPVQLLQGGRMVLLDLRNFQTKPFLTKQMLYRQNNICKAEYRRCLNLRDLGSGLCSAHRCPYCKSGAARTTASWGDRAAGSPAT